MNIGVKKDYLFKKYTAKLENIFPDTGCKTLDLYNTKYYIKVEF